MKVSVGSINLARGRILLSLKFIPGKSRVKVNTKVFDKILGFQSFIFEFHLKVFAFLELLGISKENRLTLFLLGVSLLINNHLCRLQSSVSMLAMRVVVSLCEFIMIVSSAYRWW